MTTRQYPVHVEADGKSVQTRVLDAGSGSDLVLCIHGVGSRADRFTPLLEPLAAQGYRVLALDLPGHGFADKGTIPFTVPYCADIASKVAAQYTHSRLTVIGTSLGGQIGGYMARNTTTPVHRLAMVGTLGVVPLDEKEGANISQVILKQRGVEDCRRKLTALIHDTARVTDAWALEESRINNSAGADASFDAIGRHFEGPINDHLIAADAQRLADQGAPVGMIWGSEDTIVSAETGRASMDRLPDLPMAWIRDTGHAPYWERPAAFIDALNWIFADTATRHGRERTF
ncbi:alpha/beta fold hydrolase [Streptomyces sp. NPDC048171]|uniref:alpha/beta fold hydrolase n=1 Tax=Streptomyces sp. NPDC048171 TaxID=3365504 RepID=UPI00371CE04C